MKLPLSRFLVASLALCFLALGGCFDSASRISYSPSSHEMDLVHAMAKRLDLARHVAWYKYKKHLPVHDAAREAELYARLEAEGKRLGVDPDFVKYFFKAQIAASVQLQTEYIDAWKGGAKTPSTPSVSLENYLRPEMYYCSEDMLVAMKGMRPKDYNSSFRAYAKSVLEEHKCSPKVAAIATAPLK